MIRTKSALLLAICVLVHGLAGAAGADVGTIRYDTGIATGPSTTGDPLVPDLTFGNRFDVADGLNAVPEGVLATGTVSRVTFYLAGFAPPFVYLTVFGPVSGTEAVPLATVNVTDATLGWNTYTFATPVVYSGGSFLVGIWNRNTLATGANDDAVGLDSATRLGQGHHGFSIEDLAGTGFQPLPVNALIRARGNTLPPELIFDAVVSASLDDALAVDADGTGTPTPGDTLGYTATIRNDGSEDAPIARYEASLDPTTPLVPGSVTVSAGAVTRGNAAGDPAVEVDLGGLPAGASRTVRYDVLVPDPFPGGSGDLVHQGEVAGQGFAALATDDPDAPGLADPTVTAVGERLLPFGPEASLRPRIKLRFDDVARDTLKLRVKRWELPSGFAAAGQGLGVDVGGVSLQIALDAKGRYKGVLDRVKLKRRRRDGTWKLVVKRRSGVFAPLLLDEGLDDADHADEPVQVRVRVSLGGEIYEAHVDLRYRAKAGRAGRARP